MVIRLAVAVLFALLSAAPALAQTATTPGAVTLAATFESISVTAGFSGDSNANNSVTIQFRVGGAGAFKNAYAPFIDRRALINGTSNPNNNQARGAIVGLTANTSYDVQVTWSDPDGVGTQPAIVTISTLSHTPPTGGGTTRNITNNATQASALAAANPGDTLLWAAGSYTFFTLSRSGNAGAWIILDGQGVATISGLGTTQNIALKANFVILRNFILSASDFSGITTGNGNHHLFITGNTIRGFSRLCADGPATTHLEDAGIQITWFGSATNVYVLNNKPVTGHPNLVGCLQTPSYNGPGTGIQLFTCTTCVIADNTVIGNGTRDCIAQDSAKLLTNVDFARNTCSGYMDDGIEFKGGNLNVRAWGHIITQNGNGTVGGNTCMSNEATATAPGTNFYGPSYYFRNTCKIIKSAGGCSFKGPSGPLFAFHNSLDGTGVAGNENWGFACGTGPAGAVGSGPYWLFNNASIVEAQMFDTSPSGAVSTDYNCGIASATNYASSWDGTTNYATFAAFRTGTGQEAHGINLNPRFLNAALQINATSPCVDKGILLDNFNTSDSAWPFAGAAPDIGALEVGTPARPFADAAPDSPRPRRRHPARARGGDRARRAPCARARLIATEANGGAGALDAPDPQGLAVAPALQ